MNVALATATTSAIAHHPAHAPLTRCRDDRRADDVDDIITVDGRRPGGSVGRSPPRVVDEV